MQSLNLLSLIKNYRMVDRIFNIILKIGPDGYVQLVQYVKFKNSLISKLMKFGKYKNKKSVEPAQSHCTDRRK